MSVEKFGPDETSKPAKNERVAKTAAPLGATPPLPKTDGKVAIVDEDREVTVMVRYSSLTFRPGERLTDPRKLEIAQANNIALRYK